MLFGNLGWGELGFLFVLGLLLFGPDRLPKMAGDAARVLRQLRAMANGATADLRAQLGPEFADLELTDLHPRRFVARHLLSDDEPTAGAEGRGAAAAGAPLAAGESAPYDPEAT